MPSQIFSGSTYASETSKHRDRLAPYCTGYGIDIGFGGDPITPAALRMDLPQPYARTGDLPVQLGGDCRDLRWFREDTLDYVYSSHVLEDFGEYETEPILREWTRVLRPGGHLVLLLPDQQRYLRYCEAAGLGPNAHHSIDHFSLEYVNDVAARLENVEILAEFPEIDEYSFAVVFRKTAPSASEANVVEEMRAKLESAWRERDRLAAKLAGCEEWLEQIRSHPVIRIARRLRRLLPF